MYPLSKDATPQSSTQQAPLASKINPIALGLGLYALVLGVLTFRYVRSARQMRNSIAQLPEADGAPRDLLIRLAREFGLKKIPQMGVAESGTSPFCYGWRNSTIVVPASLLGSEQLEALELVLRHELHHLSNRDLLRATFMSAGAIALWFHPLIWALRRCHSTATEELGDRAAAGGEAGRAQYRSMLASLALELRGERNLPPVALGLFRTPQIVVRLRRLGFAAPHGTLSVAARLTALFVIAAPVLLTIGALQLSAIAAPDKTTSTSSPLLDTLPKAKRTQAEKIAARGLKALLEMQREDGSFAGMRDGARGQDTGATGLAGAAILTNLHDGSDPKDKEALIECVDYILDRQKESGYFSQSSEAKSGSIYHHSIATWFLAKAINQTDGERKARIEKSLPQAVTILVKAQAVPKIDAARGGWRYTPLSRDSDISCTVWAICALHAAKEAGVEVDEKVLQKAYKYSLSLQAKDGGFAYVAPAGGMTSNVPRTAMGLYIIHLSGGGKSEAASKAAKFFRSEYRKPQKTYAQYALLWGSAAMSSHGGKEAKEYAKWLVEHSAENQQDDGSWQSSFGDALGTAFILLALSPLD